MDNVEAIKVLRSNWPYGRVMLTEACELSIKALEALEAVDNSAQQPQHAIFLAREYVQAYPVSITLRQVMDGFIEWLQAKQHAVR